MKSFLGSLAVLFWPWGVVAHLKRMQEVVLNERDYWKDRAGDLEATMTWDKRIGDVRLPHDARETMAKALEVIRALEDHRVTDSSQPTR